MARRRYHRQARVREPSMWCSRSEPGTRHRHQRASWPSPEPPVGTVTPTTTITPPSGLTINMVGTDSAGNIYVSAGTTTPQVGEILVYSAGATGAATSRVLTGAATKITLPFQVTADASGQIYVVDNLNGPWCSPLARVEMLLRRARSMGLWQRLALFLASPWIVQGIPTLPMLAAQRMWRCFLPRRMAMLLLYGRSRAQRPQSESLSVWQLIAQAICMWGTTAGTPQRMAWLSSLLEPMAM